MDILPVFITCDPARDDVNAVKTYVKGEWAWGAAVARAPVSDPYSADFHPSLVGLTGSYDDVKKTCKA